VITGKTTFHLVALDEHGKVVLKKKCSRATAQLAEAKNRTGGHITSPTSKAPAAARTGFARFVPQRFRAGRTYSARHAG
jgi:hypothetical protein